MFFDFVANVGWVVITVFHASILHDNMSGRWYPIAIPITLLISSVYGHIVEEERRWRWTMTLPGPLLVLVMILICADFVFDLDSEVDLEVFDLDEIIGYFYVHFPFWLCVAVKATDVSQVLLPMFMMVRPFHCIVLMLTLKFPLPRF